MNLTTLNKKRPGFTLVEILISASIALALFGSAYAFLTRGFFASEKNLKNLSAIQEMSLIIYSMRLDLKSFHETQGEQATYINFEPAVKTLSFNVVKNISSEGEKEYCKISYRLTGEGALIKTAEWEENKTGKKKHTQLASNNSIKEFFIKLYDDAGNEIINRKGPYKKPAFLELKAVHRTNERIEAGVVLRSFYSHENPKAGVNFWLSGFELNSAGPKAPGPPADSASNNAVEADAQRPPEISESAPDGSGKGEIATVNNMMGLSNEINSNPLQTKTINENAGKNSEGVRVIDVSTPEYRSNYNYVRDLYKTILERDLHPNDGDLSIIGVPYWVARIYAGHSRQNVKNDILASPEYFILTTFKKYRNRPHTGIEGSVFMNRLQAGESREVIEAEIKKSTLNKVQ